jgi:hypothetical protein
VAQRSIAPGDRRRGGGVRGFFGRCTLRQRGEFALRLRCLPLQRNPLAGTGKDMNAERASRDPERWAEQPRKVDRRCGRGSGTRLQIDRSFEGGGLRGRPSPRRAGDKWDAGRLGRRCQHRLRNAGNIDTNLRRAVLARPRDSEHEFFRGRITFCRSDGERRALAGAGETGAIERRCAPAPPAARRLC